MYAIEAKNLRTSFGDVIAADGVSIAIEEGGIFGILGPNGAGKTTAIRMLTGVLLLTILSPLTYLADLFNGAMNGNAVYPEGIDKLVLLIVILVFIGSAQVIFERNLVQGI